MDPHMKTTSTGSIKDDQNSPQRQQSIPSYEVDKIDKGSQTEIAPMEGASGSSHQRPQQSESSDGQVETTQIGLIKEVPNSSSQELQQTPLEEADETNNNGQGAPTSSIQGLQQSESTKTKSNEQESQAMQRRHMFVEDVLKELRKGDWKGIKNLLRQRDPQRGVRQEITRAGENILHLAIIMGKLDVVKKITEDDDEELPRYFLNEPTCYGETPTTMAASSNMLEVLKLLARKDTDALRVMNYEYNLPVTVATFMGHTRVAIYLFENTPKDLLKHKFHGPRLLCTCIKSRQDDIALRLLKLWGNDFGDIFKLRYDDSLEEEEEEDNDDDDDDHDSYVFDYHYLSDNRRKRMLLNALARRSSTSTGRLSTFVMAMLLVPRKLSTKYGAHCIQEELQTLLINRICDCIANYTQQRITAIMRKPLFTAAGSGNATFIKVVANRYFDILWTTNGKYENIFQLSIRERQTEVFKLLCGLGVRPRLNSRVEDFDENCILHQAAFLPPYNRLNCVPGPVLQMQRELQWFQEVEHLAPGLREARNAAGKTPRELFTMEHVQLVEAGEMWMKKIAESCTIVAVLVATVMFAAAFTVPGGYKGDTGEPSYLGSSYFLIFIISDAISLLFSSTSVIIFLGLHTSLYREEDFLWKLPTKLTMGFFTLFLSIIAMMVGFSITIILMLRKGFMSIALVVIMPACFPVAFFAISQLSLVGRFCESTCGHLLHRHPKYEGSTQGWLSRFKFEI